MKNIKFISCAILVFFTICFLSISAFALSGTGTEADPYLVSTPSDIALMHNDLDGYYLLTADIDMAGVDFEPIGNENEGAFTGTIDGDGHTISNLDINLPGNKYVGFVGYLEGTVKNLNLENVDACGYKYVGGLVGYAEENSNIVCCMVGGTIQANYFLGNIYMGGVSGFNSGTVEKCHNHAVINCIYSCYAGGITGFNNFGRIVSCYNNGLISAIMSSLYMSQSSWFGGIVGENSGEIELCNNFGEIQANSTTAVPSRTFRLYGGGIAGRTVSNINLCNNYGNIISFSGGGNYVNEHCLGGIVGLGESGATINSCSNNGDFSCENVVYAGGIAGMHYGNIEYCVNNGKIVNSSTNYNYGYAAGIVSNFYGSYIRSSVNTATIISKSSGGIAYSGFINQDIENCYNVGVSDYSFSNSEWTDGRSVENCINIVLPRIKQCASERVNQNIYQLKETGYVSDVSNEFHISFEDLQDQNRINGLDYDEIWFIDPNTNSGFPQLRNMPRHIDLNECVLLLKVGESDKLEAFIDGVPENVTWSSENEDIATVSADGTVTAIATGDIMITATNDEGMKMNCLVHITKDVSSVSLNKTETQITAGKTETLTYNLNPVDANEVVMWSSSNEAVATVDQNGVVTAKTKGTATITVTTVTSNKSASCEVTVVGAPITSVSITSSATVNKGTPYKLSLSVSPTQYEGTVTWSSSDESVATVAQDGTVTGLKAGSAVITVKSDTGKTSTCTVTVKIPSTEFTLNKTELTIENGMTEKLVPVLTPEDTTDTVSWSSSSTSRVSVASDGTLTAKSTGTATITATTTSGLKAYCFVTVIAARIPVTSVTLGNTELVLTRADTKQLKATVLPDNATNKTLSWTTSNENVVTVSQTGVITAVGNGTAIIRAESNNGMYYECVVKVISASGPSIVLDDAKASPGGKAVVKANIVKNPGMSAYKFTVVYDSNVLTPANITSNPEFGGTFTTNLEDAERTELNVLWHSTNDVDINGELFTVEFDVSDSAQYGDSTEVYVTYSGKDICNTNGDYIALYTDGAVIDIKEPTPGDVYEDEDVNVYDLTLLARYITFLEDFTARQQEAGDVNNDLLVDIKDVVKLSQYLVGWSGATLMSETATLMSDKKPEIVVGTASENANGDVVIPVSIKNNPGITGLNYKIDYSTDELEILSIIPNTELLASNFITNLGYEDERGLAVTWHQNDNMTSDGVLFTINAKLKGGINVGAITIVPADNNMCNQNGEDVIATYADGYILAESYVVKEQSVSDGAFTCNMYFDETFTEQSATAIVAFYNGTKFVKMAFVPITVKEGKVDVTIPCDKVSYISYKVFVWKDLVSMKPLVEAKQN